MTEAACVRCGAPVRWVTVAEEGKMPLDSVPTFNGRYALDPDDVNLATRIEQPGRYGYMSHDETCPRG